MPSEIGQTEEDKYCVISLIYMGKRKQKQNNPKAKLIDTEKRLEVARGGGGKAGQMGEGGQKAQNSHSKIRSPEDGTHRSVTPVTVVTHTTLYIRKLQRE